MFFGRLMIMIASKGHFCGHRSKCYHRQAHAWVVMLNYIRILTFTQMPQPMHSSSDIQATLEFGEASTQSLPV